MTDIVSQTLSNDNSSNDNSLHLDGDTIGVTPTDPQDGSGDTIQATPLAGTDQALLGLVVDSERGPEAGPVQGEGDNDPSGKGLIVLTPLEMAQDQVSFLQQELTKKERQLADSSRLQQFWHDNSDRVFL